MKKQELDELAMDPKRYSVLDVMGMLSKGRRMISRLLMISQVGDGAKQQDIEEDFRAKIGHYNRNGSNAETTALLAEVTDWTVEDILITGLLYFVGSFVVHFLEAPTESLFHVVKNVNKDLCTNTKIMYLTECHGVRTSKRWQTFYGTAKLGELIPDDPSQTARIFGVYKRLLELHCEEGSGHDQDFYRRNSQNLPHLEDINRMMDTALNPDSYTLEAFLAFHCVGAFPDDDFLHGELLWPVPPPLRYYDDEESPRD